MAASMYDLYSEIMENNPDLSPIVRGGVNRAKTATRDIQGRFMPKSKVKQSRWTLDDNHGVPGGKARQAQIRKSKGIIGANS